MINIQEIAVNKGTDIAVGNININSTGNGGVSTGIEGHYLWGHYFDATQDIDGDLISVGNIKGGGSITMDGDINITNVNASGDINGQNANIEGDVKSNTVNTNIVYTKEIYSDNINNTGSITTSELTAAKAYIQQLLSENIKVDNLTVTKAAHFFKLIIDEIKSTNGMFILSVGNTELDHVGHVNGTTYRCFYKATDGSDKIHQIFEVNDQVVCETFNAASGVSYNVSNKYYWMLANGIGSVDIIPIASNSVELALLSHFDSDGDGLISLSEFNAISGVSDYFSTSAITGTFHELAYMSGVTSVGNNAFLNTGLSEISLPESVTTIGTNAFKGASGLYQLNLPTQLTAVGNNAFEACESLNELIILRGTTGNSCFKGCSRLTYLQLGEGTTHITAAMFNGVDSIETLVLPSTVTVIDADSFSGLTDLKRIYLKATSVPTISGATTFNITSQFFSHIYVPTSSLDTYNNTWSFYSDRLTPYTYTPIGTGTQLNPSSIAEKYHYVDLTTTDKDSSSNGVPEAGDSIAVLGNRTDTDRQAAIILSAYNSGFLDNGVTAPFIAQYAGIDDYDLPSHRVNVISKGKNEFYGQFTVIVEGQEIPLDEYIAEVSPAEPHIEVDSELVQIYTDKEGYITSLQDVKGLPLQIRVKMGGEYIPIEAWTTNSYIKYNGNDNTPLIES